jgi:hypothetical protein
LVFCPVHHRSYKVSLLVENRKICTQLTDKAFLIGVTDGGCN